MFQSCCVPICLPREVYHRSFFPARLSTLSHVIPKRRLEDLVLRLLELTFTSTHCLKCDKIFRKVSSSDHIFPYGYPSNIHGMLLSGYHIYRKKWWLRVQPCQMTKHTRLQMHLKTVCYRVTFGPLKSFSPSKKHCTYTA